MAALQEQHFNNTCPQCGCKSTCRCMRPHKIETHDLCPLCKNGIYSIDEIFQQEVALGSMMAKVAARWIASSCFSGHSFAWISPEGVLHKLNGITHDDFSMDKVDPDKLTPELTSMYPLNYAPTAFLLNEGWIRVSNATSFEASRRSRAKAWRRAMIETINCTRDNKLDPFTHKIIVDWVSPHNTSFERITIDEAVHRFAPDLESTLYAKTAASYKKKREVPKANGKGTTTIYEYSERQVANRHREKANRIEALRKKLPDLRKKVIKDLDSDDPKTKLTALAIALMDETYERVGNSESAEERDHHGVTTWEVSHVKIKDGTATFKYTGKSGVDHEKKITDKKIVSCLKTVVEGKKSSDKILSDDDVSIAASHVNDYLKPFDITAKDIRGLHANREVVERLKEVRKKGPSELPKARKEKDKVLKAEFLEALEGAAEAVGHESATLRGQYLVPGLEDAYMHDGTILEKLNGG